MDFEKEITRQLNEDAVFQEALSLVKRNSQGKIWLAGGYLFRRLTNILYKTNAPEDGDLDFIAESYNNYLMTGDWGVRLNSYGNPKFRKGEQRIDLISLNNIPRIQRKGLEPTIANYLAGVPLTIQSLVYEIDKAKLIGEIGLNALKSKTVAINNVASLRTTCKRKGLTQKQYLTKYAEILGFTVVK